MDFSGSPEAQSTSEIIALPSISGRPGSGTMKSTKRALLAERSTKARPPPLRSQSVEPGMIDGAPGDDGPGSLTGFSSFALYCEVKLKESRSAGVSDGLPDLNVVRTCFTLLDKICDSDATMAGPLRSVTEELREAIFSEQVDLGGGGERKTYFSLVTELEAEADRMKRNTAQLVSQATMGLGNGEGSGAAGEKERRKKDMMTQSRLMHLETEMHHMFDSVQHADETILKMKTKEKTQNKLVKELQDEIASLKFELESSVATCKRAVRPRSRSRPRLRSRSRSRPRPCPTAHGVRVLAPSSAHRAALFEHLCLQEMESDRLSAKLKGIEFERVKLGFGSQDARSQLDTLQARNERLETVVAEKNAEMKRAGQERARLSFRVQELKKSILGMVPRGEVEATWKELGTLKEKVRDAQREAHNWKAKADTLADEHSEVDDVINYMTPRPDWSQVGQYASGETDGVSSAELVQGLYRTIDEMRGLTGDGAEWDDEGDDHFEGLGKSKDLPLYLQWEGEVRNRHFSKREMDQFTGEIFENKKKYEMKRGKASSLSGYINSFFSEKFGIQARIAEFGYNMVDTLQRMSHDPFLEQFALCLHDQLDTSVLEYTIALPERVKKIWEKIDLSNEGKIGHMLSKPTLLNSLKKEWPILSELDERKIKQILNNASEVASVRYMTLIDPEQAELGLMLGERTPLILVLEEATWRDRKAYINQFIQGWLKVLESTGALEDLEDPMAATINAATAKRVMLETDPTLKEKFVVETLTRAFGSAALVKGKSGKTVAKLKDSATIAIGDLGTNLSRLNIFRKIKKDTSGAAQASDDAAKNLAKMFPSMTSMALPAAPVGFDGSAKTAGEGSDRAMPLPADAAGGSKGEDELVRRKALPISPTESAAVRDCLPACLQMHRACSASGSVPRARAHTRAVSGATISSTQQRKRQPKPSLSLSCCCS